VNRKSRPRNTTVPAQLLTPTPTLDATIHSIADGRTARRQYHSWR